MALQIVIPCTVEEARDLTDRIKACVEQTWALLLEAHERRAWAALGYDRWEDYVRGEFDMHRRTSYKLLDQARVIREINAAVDVPLGAHEVTVTEREARDLKPILPEFVEEVRERVRSLPEPTPERIQQVVRERVDQARAEVRERREQAAVVAELTPPGFDPQANAELVAERGAFFRLCRDLPALGDPEEFLARNRHRISAERIPVVEEAYAWLHDFLALWREP